MQGDLESRTLNRIAWRFIPFLIVCSSSPATTG